MLSHTIAGTTNYTYHLRLPSITPYAFTYSSSHNEPCLYVTMLPIAYFWAQKKPSRNGLQLGFTIDSYCLLGTEIALKFYKNFIRLFYKARPEFALPNVKSLDNEAHVCGCGPLILAGIHAGKARVKLPCLTVSIMDGKNCVVNGNKCDHLPVSSQSDCWLDVLSQPALPVD